MNKTGSKSEHRKPQIGGWLIGASLLALIFTLSLIQGYWRHDAWIYTDSEAHEIIDGKWLADPLHAILHDLPPSLSILLAFLIVSLFLTAEISRIYRGRHWTSSMATICALSLFSPSFLSQLHWPTHALAGSLPLLLSMCWIEKSSLLWRLWRAFLISFGSLSILSSFAFFAPLCLLPERDTSPSTSARSKLIWLDVWSVAFASPMILGASLLLTKLIRDSVIANHASFPELPSRLDLAFTTNYTELVPGLIAISTSFLLRQWGWLGLSIPIVVALISVWSVATHSKWGACISCATVWILLIPIFASAGSGTSWQRVALAWCCIPTLAALAITDLRKASLRRGLLVLLMAASACSALIGMYNFSISALSTRDLRNKVTRQTKALNPMSDLLIIDVRSIDSLSPKYIWGGWPPFAKSNHQNVRFHRVLDELHIHHYVIHQRELIFPPDLSDSTCIRHAITDHNRQKIRDCYNQRKQVELKNVLHINL